ncbi:MAG: hypothetical protein ACR2NP_06030 [Pirellulaceae bacterium]
MDVKHGALLVAMLWICCLAGCGQSPVAENSGTTEPEETPPATASLQKPDSTQLIIGTWYGRARLNTKLLNRKLESITDAAARERVQITAQIFQSTEIGVVFSDNGTMELEIEIQPAGQEALRDNTRGTWKAIEVLPNAIVLETTEPAPNGGTETKRVRYQFEMDGQVAIMVAPTSESLADCNPVFVFQRVDAPAAATAGRANNSLIR